MKGVLVSGPASGVGKTTVAASLMAALRHRGLRVQPFKCGPDFIDPGHHKRICGRASHNLDTWIMPAEVNQQIFSTACQDADIAVVEGMMGLFDGVRGGGEEGSSAEISKMFEIPVLLVIDASSSARSVAAVVHGFQNFDSRVRMAGVMLNRAANSRHAGMLMESIRERNPHLWIGWLPHQKELKLPERHLGLHTAEEGSWSGDAIKQMAALIDEHCPLDSLLESCEFDLPVRADRLSPTKSEVRVRLGVARDRAFCFYYEAGLEELRRQGAEIIEFSPLEDDRMPAELDAVYFGGGYPELYAEQLSNRVGLISDLRAFASDGRLVYGECGGLMFLSKELRTLDGRRFSMAGLLPLTIEMTERLVHFGYADVQFIEDGIGQKDTWIRGHSFHCSKITSEGKLDKTALIHYSLSGMTQPEGFAIDNVFGSYVHLHFASDPSLAARFITLASTAAQRGHR